MYNQVEIPVPLAVPLRTVLPSALIAALAPFSPLAAATVESPTKPIARAEEAYSQSFVTRDVRIAERVVAAGLRRFRTDGKTSDKASILADVRSQPRSTS